MDIEWTLVTGGAGFIGSHLCEKLLQTDNVICLDNLYTGQLKNISKFYKTNKNSFIFLNIDVCDTKLLNKVASLYNISKIYHLACPASPPAYQKDPLKTTDTCYIGSKNMLEIAKKYKIPILLTSTSEIYGDPVISPQKEEYWGNVNSFGPRSCYDVGKRMMETLAYSYIQNKVDVKIARIFNTYGPNMDIDDGRVITNFIKQCINNKDITIYGDGKQTRSFCYVLDMVDGLVKLMASDYHKPLNLGFPKEHTINQLATLIAKIFKNEEREEDTFVFIDLPVDDPKQRLPDITKAKEILGWVPIITLEEGIKKMFMFNIS